MEKNEVGEGRESLREVKECNVDRVAGEVTLEQRCGGPEGEALRIAGGGGGAETAFQEARAVS